MYIAEIGYTTRVNNGRKQGLMILPKGVSEYFNWEKQPCMAIFLKDLDSLSNEQVIKILDNVRQQKKLRDEMENIKNE